MADLHHNTDAEKHAGPVGCLGGDRHWHVPWLDQEDFARDPRVFFFPVRLPESTNDFPHTSAFLGTHRALPVADLVSHTFAVGTTGKLGRSILGVTLTFGHGAFPREVRRDSHEINKNRGLAAVIALTTATRRRDILQNSKMGHLKIWAFCYSCEACQAVQLLGQTCRPEQSSHGQDFERDGKSKHLWRVLEEI